VRSRRRDKFAGTGAGKFVLDLSMVSIVHVYPREYSRKKLIDLPTANGQNLTGCRSVELLECYPHGDRDR
jgi:hypothetical protein